MRVCIGIIMLAAYFCPWACRCDNTVGAVGFFKCWTEVPCSLWKCRHWSIAPGMSDYYWTTVNTIWRTANQIQVFMECTETTPTFFTWYLYYANSEYRDATDKQLYIQPCSIMLHLYLLGTDKNTQLTLFSQRKLALTAINTLFAIWNHWSPQKIIKPAASLT